MDLKKLVNKLSARVTGLYNYVNNSYMKYYINEVKGDIRYLRNGLKDAKFERDRNDFFQSKVKKYKESYCPSTYHELFSSQNQFTYACLRSDIDDLLNLNEQEIII